MAKDPQFKRDADAVEVIEIQIRDFDFSSDALEKNPLLWEMSRQPNIYIDDVDFPEE